VRRFALAVVSLLVALLAAEAGVRFLAPQPVGAASSLLRGPLNVPGDHPVRTAEYDVVVHVNARGFVDREWGPKTGSRVVVIGDSFVQAAQVPLENGFGRVLDAALPDAEVLSMGVPGAGTATALGLLETYALPMDPDVVLLGFLVANDVMNNHPGLEPKVDKPFYTLRGGELVPVAGGALWRASHLVRWVDRTWTTREISRARLEAGDGVPLELRVYDPDAGPVWEEAWTLTDALVGEMARACRDNGVAFGVVLFPDANALHPERRGLRREDADAAWYRAKSLAEAHAPTLDLRPAYLFRDSLLGDGDGDWFFPVDGHWTAAGHRVAAETTAPFAADLIGRSASPSSAARPGP
jgi:hypothetical protein